MTEWSRRDFCTACAGAFVAACTTRSGIETGALDPVDAAPPVDGETVMVDAGGAVCSGTPVDVGAPATFTVGTPVYITTGRFFVVKDAMGFYALTSICPHAGVVMKVSSGRFRCPRHGALFTFNGAIISGPVSRPLVHYAMCVLDNGHLGVTTSVTVVATTRLVA